MTWKDKTILGAILLSQSFNLRHKKYGLLPNNSYLSIELADIKTQGISLLWSYPKDDVKEWYLDIEDCTLLARKVESLSEEEKEQLRRIKNDWEVHADLNPDMTPIYKFDYSNNVKLFLYLLSIGVLPESLADESVEWIEG